MGQTDQIKQEEKTGGETQKRVPIKKRLLTTVLITTIFAILTVSITGALSIRWIRRSTEKILTEELEANLRNDVRQNVRVVTARLEHYEKYIQFMTDAIEDMYRDEKENTSGGRMFGPPRDTHDYELTRAFASADLTPEKLRDEMLFYSNVEKVWKQLAKENKGIITTFYLGTRNGLLVSYDNYSYLSVPPKGKELIYNYYVSEWYKKGIKDKDVFYTGIYMDSQGRGLTITVGSRFRDAKGEPAGVICMDFDLDLLYDELFRTDFDDDTFIFTLDSDGAVISPDSDTLDIQEYTGLTLDELEQFEEDPNGIIEKNDFVYICVPMEHADWTLFARVPKNTIHERIHDSDSSIWSAFVVFMLIVLLIIIATVFMVNKNVTDVTHPLELLEKDIKIISSGNLDYRASVYRNDEIGDITRGMNEMLDRLSSTRSELATSQQYADTMSRLATRDGLTGVRNKMAFKEQIKDISKKLAEGEDQFGFAVLDLNDLKTINDNYGHDKGDQAIISFCKLICRVFGHSPVFRIGGDEFVVVLMNEDYQNIESLVRRFNNRSIALYHDTEAEPWERISGAIGYALYDEELDDEVDSVVARADKEMYICKKAMKGASGGRKV